MAPYVMYGSYIHGAKDMPSFQHRNLTVHEASAVREFMVLDGLRAPLMGAQVLAANMRIRVDYLDNFAKLLGDRRNGLLKVLDGGGLMFAPVEGSNGVMMPKGFMAIQEGR